MYSSTEENITISKSLAETGKILFDVRRSYEIHYVIRKSEQSLHEGNHDYYVQIYFLPLSGNVTDSTSLENFMFNISPNHVFVTLTTPFYYIFNQEQKTTDIGPLFLSLMLVGKTIVELFVILLLIWEIVWFGISKVLALYKNFTAEDVEDDNDAGSEIPPDAQTAQ